MEIEYLKLTPKEDEIYKLLLKGFGVYDIAGELNKSPFTIQQQMCNIYNKRYCSSRPELLAQRIAELEEEVKQLKQVLNSNT
jgi:DNA-binding NarL/FixJ family response regulator